MNEWKKAADLLRTASHSLALAESCTGGMIASRFTDIPGASGFFHMGFVTYSNRSKEVFLDVPGEVIAAHGAVSAEVAELMARGARRRAGVSISLAVTGIAGPEGGTQEKPVGTVYIALAWDDGVLVRRHLFQGDRGAIREQTCNKALDLLVGFLEGDL